MAPKLTVVPYGDELGMEELTQELVLSTRDKLLVFYSSPDQEKGEMWCPDCRTNEPLLHEALESVDEPSLKPIVVYVGQKEEWREPHNACRLSPFHVERIPTLIYVRAMGDEPTALDAKLRKAPHLVEEDANDPSKLHKLLDSHQ